MPNANPRCGIAPVAADIGGSQSTSWLARTARLYPRAGGAARVAPTDPALCVATDFARDEPRTIACDRCIDDALREMECADASALLVVQADLVIGLITARGIEEGRPGELFEQLRSLALREMEVQDIMVPWDRVATLEWTAVCEARAGDIEGYFRNTRTSHVLLVEQVEDYGSCVRGLISRNRVEREMGRTLWPEGQR